MPVKLAEQGCFPNVGVRRFDRTVAIIWGYLAAGGSSAAPTGKRPRRSGSCGPSKRRQYETASRAAHPKE